MLLRHSSLAMRSLGAFLLLGIAPLEAHDFWIEPQSFRSDVGTPVPVFLRVGEDFNGTSQPYVPDWFLDFSVSTADTKTAIEGLVGDDPAASLLPKTPGLRVIGYHSERSFVSLEAARFNPYLAKEGLDGIIALRKRRGESNADGREYYSRCAKSLVAVGPGTGAGYERVLGYPLEIIPAANPFGLKPGKSLPLLLRYLGKPLAGVLVVAFTADKPTQRFAKRTGADGLVTLPLDRPGRWLVKAVHMIEVPDTDIGGDWESFWASLTFEIAK